MDKGFVMIPRALLMSEAWRKATKEQRLAIVDLCCRVAYSEHEYELNGETIEVGKGQMAVTQSMLAKEWGMTRSQTRTLLSNLEKWGVITSKNIAKGFSQYTLLTLSMLASGVSQGNRQHTEEYNNLSKDKYPPNNARVRESKTFLKPTAEEVQAYLDEKGITTFTGEHFVAHYEACGWVVGGQGKKMKSWKAAVITWREHDKQYAKERRMNNGTGTNAQGCNAGYAGREERDRAFQQHIIEQLEHPTDYSQYEIPM